MEPEKERSYRPMAFDKMEGLVREVSDPENGVPVRSQKLFLTFIPCAFLGIDMIEWLMQRLNIEESGTVLGCRQEAHNVANLLCQYGYFFPVHDWKCLSVRDDSSLYRFQSPYYWPLQNRPPDNVEYAIYLAKRTLRNKQRHGLEDYELEALGNLKKNLANRWDVITMMAGEQAKISKGLKKIEKVVNDSQERAYWRIHRPPPGMLSSLEQCPVPNKIRLTQWRTRKITIDDCKREVELLKNGLTRTRTKASLALENMLQYTDTYSEYDYLITNTQPSNPWVSEDTTFWQLNNPIVEVPTEKRVKRWGLSMEELISDPTGIQEFTNYLRKEYSHENIRFWMAVNDLRRSSQTQIQRKVKEIFDEFLAPGAPCEINIDGKTMERVHQEMKSPSRFTFDCAQEHVYTLLLKKDCYPRFIRSEHYKTLLATGIQPSQKKRFFGFGPTKKKISTTSAPNPSLLQQQPPQGTLVSCGALSKRRGSDRSLSGSAHELAISGVKDTRVPHSHSQSNLSDIPYRGDLPGQSKLSNTPLPSPAEVNDESEEIDPESACRVKKPPSVAVVASTSTSEDVCPWEAAAVVETHSRKNSAQMDSCSSSSDISATITEVSDRFRRTCGITQQNTLDGDRRGQTSRKLSTASFVEQRRASVSVPIRHADIKPSASSFEERNPAMLTAPVSPSATSDTDNKIEEITLIKTFKKSSSLTKTCSVTGANAPIISVSSVTDDTVIDSNEEFQEIEPEASCSQPLAPLAEPDGESPGSEILPEPDSGPDSEAKRTDVCPWEDEETCKMDAPFVKTYATLGYL